jgi:hypothetical protein
MLTLPMIPHSVVACWTLALRQAYDSHREAYTIPTFSRCSPSGCRATLGLAAGSGDISVDHEFAHPDSVDY